MPRTRAPYPPEFRQQMVELVRAGRTPEELSREFEPTAQTIHNWVKQVDIDTGVRSDGLTTEERGELRRLRREVKHLRIEQEVLKKARSYTSSRVLALTRKKSAYVATAVPVGEDDVWSRRVIGWSMATHLRTEFVLDAMNMAVWQRRPEKVIHHSDQGTQGGFKGSSQHLREELRCLRRSADARIELYVRGCGHPAGRGWDGGSIGGGSGRKSLEVCRARRRPWRWVCHPLSEHAGFANVAACHLSNCIHCRGVIYRSSSEKRSPFFEPAVVVCARSLGSLAAHPRRSLESCGATQPRVVGTSNIGPRPRSGTPSDERNVLRLPSSL